MAKMEIQRQDIQMAKKEGTECFSDVVDEEAMEETEETKEMEEEEGTEDMEPMEEMVEEED